MPIGFVRALQNRISGSFLRKAVQNAVRFSGLLIALFAFNAQAQADAQNSISALSVSTGNGVTVIKVELARPLARLPTGFTINTPPRIAFDFPDTAKRNG